APAGVGAGGEALGQDLLDGLEVVGGGLVGGDVPGGGGGGGLQGHGGELAQGHLGGGDSGASLRGRIHQGGDLQQVAVAGREAAEGPGHGVQVIRRGGACGSGVDGGPCHVGIGDKGGLVEVQQGGQLTVAQKLEGRPEGLL